MRRAYGGGAFAENRNVVYEEGNDTLVDGLKSKTSTLKSLCIDIGTEIRSQKNLLEDVDNEFDHTGGFLSSTSDRVKRLIKSGHYRYLFYLIAFSFGVFLVIYMILRLR